MSSETQFTIGQVCDEIKHMLIEKNKSYGDSALNPVRIFEVSQSAKQEKQNQRKDLNDRVLETEY